MQGYDAAVKSLLRSSPALTIRELAGTAVAHWLDAELPKVQNLRLDLLGETVDGGLVHVELQSNNVPAIPLRNGGILPGDLSAIWPLAALGLAIRWPAAHANGERVAWSGHVVRLSPARYSGVGWRAPPRERRGRR